MLSLKVFISSSSYANFYFKQSRIICDPNNLESFYFLFQGNCIGTCYCCYHQLNHYLRYLFVLLFSWHLTFISIYLTWFCLGIRFNEMSRTSLISRRFQNIVILGNAVTWMCAPLMMNRIPLTCKTIKIFLNYIN